MTDEVIGEDETYKYIFKKLHVRFHRRLGYDGNEIVFINIELIPPHMAHKYMDIGYVVDGKQKYNIEFQSTAVYNPKMEDMYKYRVYSQADEFQPFKTCVFATYPPTQGIENKDFDGDVDFHPDFFYTKNLKASEIINVVANKNNIPLSDDEAIDLLIAPDMAHNYEIKELLKTTSELLLNAKIPDKELHCDLIDCQRKVMQRFLKKDERKEMEKMLNLKAKDYGFEPNVTGFEEAVNLSYLDGKREGYDNGKKEGYDNGKKEGYDNGKKEGYDNGKKEGYDNGIKDGYDNAKLETAERLIELGIDDDIIIKVTELDLKTIQHLKNE